MCLSLGSLSRQCGRIVIGLTLSASCPKVSLSYFLMSSVLETVVSYMCLPLFVSGRWVNTVPVGLSWPEMEVLHLLLLFEKHGEVDKRNFLRELVIFKLSAVQCCTHFSFIFP